MSEGLPKTVDDPLSDILVAALELEGEARSRFLDEACADDEALRAEIESLLAAGANRDLDRFLATPAAEQLAPGSRPHGKTAGSMPLPDQIGPYQLVKRLGAGGMGTVFLAQQDQPVKRQVALKVIPILHREAMRRRFAIECQALARLNHPNIASMYDAGQPEPGSPLHFVAMEWIDGSPITRWCDAMRVDVRGRLEIFLRVCAGVAHAHEKGVLHCDLKPSNVLVTQVDGQAIPKVIDFGIARALGEPLEESGDTTQEMVLGSPPYISPEAFTPGGRHDLDVRSDVYLLGLLLYELLVGVLPFETEGLGMFAISRRIRENAPPQPSERFEQLDLDDALHYADLRSSTPPQLIRRIRQDLDAILLKAVDRDPKRRYGSPSEFAADIERHLECRPVKARPPSTSYSLSCFVRRHRHGVLAAVLLTAVMIGGFVAQSIEANRAQQALKESEHVRSFMVTLFESADPERAIGEALTVRELLDQGVERLREDLTSQPLVQADLLHTIGSIYIKLGALEAATEVIHEALDLRRERLPEDHPKRIDSESELGVLYRRQGRFDEAEPFLLSVLEARQADPSTDLEILARAYNNLGNLYWSQERFEEAQQAHHEALTLRQKNTALTGTSEARSNEAISANNLGVMLQSRGAYDEARPILRQAVDLLRAENHALLGTALNNLGLVEQNLSTWKEAEGLFREAIAIHEASVHASHMRPLSSRLNLVSELGHRHRWEEARAEGQDIVELSTQLDDVLGLARTYRILGNIELQAGRPDAAIAIYRQAVEVMLPDHGPEHLDTLRGRGLWAVALAQAGEKALALEEIHELERLIEDRLANDHPSRLRLEKDFGRVLFALGRFADAQFYFERYVAGQQRNRGPEDLYVALGLHELGRSNAARGYLDEAAHHLRQSLDLRQARFGEAHPLVAESAHELGLVELERQQIADARRWLELAWQIRQAVYPPGDRDTEASRKALERL